MDAIRALWWKRRMSPVMAWSLGALAISVGYAVHDLHSVRAMHWQLFALVVGGLLLVPSVVVRGVYRRSVTSWLYAGALRRLPVLSEWVTAFPLMVASTVGAYYLLAEMWEPALGWAALLHALLSVAWLTQAHLRDLAWKPRGDAAQRRVTTVAYVARRFGKGAARHVPAGYFLLTAFVGTVATLQVAHVFFFTVLCALLGAISSWNTQFGKVRRLHETHGKMVVTMLVHGVLLALWVAWI